MSTKLSADSIATLLAALCASTAIACGGSQPEALSAPPLTAREVASEREAPAAEAAAEPAAVPPADPASAASEAPPTPPAREAHLATPAPIVDPPAAPAAEAPRATPKRAPARKKAAQGGCGSGTCA